MSPGPPQQCDLAVVGGGILGLAVARELTRRRPGASATVLEAAPEVATGQTGTNSGVIHAGIYYAPGSLKAQLCVAGAREMYAYCEANSIDHERCGKLIVARHDGELAALDELERRGRANEVPGLRRLTADELREVEPHCVGTAALLSPATGIVDFAQVARSLAAELEGAGVPVVTSCAVTAMAPRPGRVVARTRARGAPRRASPWSAPERAPAAWRSPRGRPPTRASCPSAAPTSTCGPSAARSCAA